LNGRYDPSDPNGEIPTQNSFYFRLAGKYLYFTETSKDLNVIGAMSFCQIDDYHNVFQ
jgi:hypothetical protein